MPHSLNAFAPLIDSELTPEYLRYVENKWTEFYFTLDIIWDRIISAQIHLAHPRGKTFEQLARYTQDLERYSARVPDLEARLEVVEREIQRVERVLGVRAFES